MVFIKRINTLIIDSNLFAALGVWSLVKLTGLLHSVDVDDFAIFSFFSTLLVYSFSILFSALRVKGFDSLFYLNYLLIQKVVLVVSILIIPSYLIEFSIDILLMLVPVGLVSFLYPVEIASDKEKSIALREFPYLKIFLIGVSWGVVTVVLPLINTSVNLDFSILIEMVVRTLFVVAITIPFDVRDMYSDSPNMKTIPQEIGASKAKILAYLLLILNLIYYFFYIPLSVESLFFILVTLVVTSVLVRYSGNNRPKYYYTILIESTSILLFLSVSLSYYSVEF